MERPAIFTHVLHMHNETTHPRCWKNLPVDDYSFFTVMQVSERTSGDSLDEVTITFIAELPVGTFTGDLTVVRLDGNYYYTYNGKVVVDGSDDFAQKKRVFDAFHAAELHTMLLLVAEKTTRSEHLKWIDPAQMIAARAAEDC